jgi:putative thiamine transport system ATP-binding protein
MIGALEALSRQRRAVAQQRRCDERPTERRRIGILFQDALLFDHFSVGQNLLALRQIRGAARKISSRRWNAPGWPGSFPRSGDALRRPARPGQPAARPAGGPLALLLDEPFNRLDAELRAGFRRAGYLMNWRARPFRRCW